MQEFKKGEEAKALNALAREEMKLKLMQDIKADIIVCKIEGINYKDYLLELKDIIDSFLGIKKN